MQITEDSAARALIATRILNAPRELVYQMFTDPGHIDKWYGPKGCTTQTSVMDVEIGGKWIYTMNMPNGNSFDAFHIFTEIIDGKRLVFDSARSESDPDEQWFTTEVDLKDADGGTEISITMSYKSDAMFEQAKQYGAMRGYTAAIEKMVEYISTL